MPINKIFSHTKSLLVILKSAFATFILLIVVFVIGLFVPSKDKNLLLVTKVTGGDTIVVQGKGRDITVRLVGIDAPEVRRNECYQNEATEYLTNLVLNKKVRLEYDRDTIDRFGRDLAYVYIKPYGSNSTPKGAQTLIDPTKEEMVNELLLRSGHARYSISEVNTKYQEKFLAAANLAQENSNGLWGSCGNTEDLGKCIIKGNVDKNGNKYYYLPGDPYYDSIVINLNKEDQWLCTFKEAEDKNFARVNSN